MQFELTPTQFGAILPAICSFETSSDCLNWSPVNPTYGHCAVASLLAQNLFGGEILRGSLENTPFAYMRSHYWNRLSDGTLQDFTGIQFGGVPINFSETATRTPKQLLDNPDTRRRYTILLFRLLSYLSKNNPLFEDLIYKGCFQIAMESPCQKMKFGAMLIDKSGSIVAHGCNKTISPIASFCEPECIRFKIQSRTESMIGACGHAEEFVLWDGAKSGVDLSECSLYVAGFSPNGFPWIKTVAEATCLRCAVQMFHSRVKTLYVPVINRWVGISPEVALKTAQQYATREKTV